jgi:beta-lactamase superfamily II metal-dependent hydrolase
MAGSIFTLEALKAAHGDALILHYGTLAAPKHIVIDGGPPGVFKAALEPRLKQIHANRGGGVLELRMLLVSHIDDDHVSGLLEFTKSLRDKQDGGAPLPFDILTLWHNSFDDIAGAVSSSLPEAQKHLKPLKDPDAAAIVASVAQGRQLRLDADALGLNMNSGFDDLIQFDQAAVKKLNMGGGLRFTVLGPRKAEIAALQKKWDGDVKKLLAKGKKTKGAKGRGRGSALIAADLQRLAAAFVDQSIHNLSSLVVLAESGGKRILLTGDARGDFILQSLQEAQLLESGKVAIDVFKLPHHGSNRNAALRLFKAISADHYVISADGKYGNPDNDTIGMIFKARPTGEYHIWLTNDIKSAVTYIKKKKPAGVTLHVRPPADLSVRIELDSPIAW